jgi:hypothetical protein
MNRAHSCMGTDIETLKRRLTALEAAIAETKKRVPAHSIKPPVMMDLLNLEDERDLILDELRTHHSAK